MLGATVTVTQAGDTFWRHAHTDGSYASSRDPRVLVGLGVSKKNANVRVMWPNGEVEEWIDLRVDRYTTLTQGQSAAP